MQVTIDDRQTDARPAWAGWFRTSKREPWRQLVTAESHDAAWAALLDALAQLGHRGGDSVVVPAAENPNHGASTRR